MKTKLFARSLVAMTLMASLSAMAGEKGLNGGDMCEDRIKTVRDDVQSWITNHGSSGLTLPENITLDRYNAGMLTQIQNAQLSCTESVVMVGNAEKTCKNFLDTDGTPRIVCNAKRFMDTSESDQYILTHHEYAGLAGFEKNNGEESKYPISNQISEFLSDQFIKKLAVKTANPTDSKSSIDLSLSAEQIPLGTVILTRSDIDVPPSESYIQLSDPSANGVCYITVNVFDHSDFDRVLHAGTKFTVVRAPFFFVDFVAIDIERPNGVVDTLYCSSKKPRPYHLTIRDVIDSIDPSKAKLILPVPQSF
jgi:hypothetical protein